MSDDLHQDVHDLEVWKARAEERFHTLFHLAGQQTEALKQATDATNALRLELKVYVATVSGYKPCPDPGACLALKPRVESLELSRAEAAGGWKVLAALTSAAGTVGGFVGWFISHFLRDRGGH